MNVVMFYHSRLSGWNHGNAHFLRGLTAELQAWGHAVRVYEPAGAAACIITDTWEGLALFLEPGVECIAAENGAGVAEARDTLSPGRAREMGRRARQRVLAEHTYAQWAGQVEQYLLAGRDALSGT